MDKIQRNHIKVFVASTVYNFESDLDKIYELLDGFAVMDILLLLYLVIRNKLN
ncbi:MAG: hypothetical protein LBT25_08220 [Candidatus Symbiothrix sp.]|jgi:hypothetical protein|nr:hypothetical protein [Candidatus Symbiothrix sp.]